VNLFRSIIRCNQFDMIHVTPKAGQLYFTVDSRLLFKDNGPNLEQRLRFNAVILNTDFERTTTIRPEVGRFYYVDETNSLWLFDTRWILKVGNTTSFNAFSTYNTLSPVINMDESITNATGDRIIDNNGLLSDGSVVIRDTNRIIRGRLNANTVYNELQFNSYLDNGFVFVPMANLPYDDLTSSFGSLRLTNSKTPNDSNGFDIQGESYYYGEWNNFGQMYIVLRDELSPIYPDETPINNKEIIKSFITTRKTEIIDGNSQVIVTYLTIRPISTNQGIIQIISLYNENLNSVIMNDMGELIFTNNGSLLDNTTITCDRSLRIDDNVHIAEYVLEQYGVTLTLKKDDTGETAIVPDIWFDNSHPTLINTKRWLKKRVLTEDDL